MITDNHASPAPLFDTHCHLGQPEFHDDRDEVLTRAREAGVIGILCVGIDAPSSEAAVQLAEAHDFVFAAVGIQPNSCCNARPDDWNRLVRLAEHPKVVAIGETGLDRYWDFTPFDLQENYFLRHLELARNRELPVVIHCREADADLLPLLERAAQQGELRAVMHAFSSDSAMAARCLELGLFISFSGNVTYRNQKFGPLREAAKAVPKNRLLVETDSPYLVPHPLRGRQKRNEPAWVAHTVGYLAELRDQNPAELSRQTTENAWRLFGIASGANRP